METVVNGLAQNNYIVSIANAGGVIAFLVLVYGFARWAYAFGKAAYRQNIRVAIYRARRRNFVRAKMAALDLHIFVAAIVMQAVSIIFSFSAVVMGFISWAARGIIPADDKFSTTFHLSSQWDTLVGRLLLFAPVALLTYTSFRLFDLAATTRRIRIKLVRRRSRTAAELAGQE